MLHYLNNQEIDSQNKLWIKGSQIKSMFSLWKIKLPQLTLMTSKFKSRRIERNKMKETSRREDKI